MTPTNNKPTTTFIVNHLENNTISISSKETPNMRAVIAGKELTANEMTQQKTNEQKKSIFSFFDKPKVTIALKDQSGKTRYLNVKVNDLAKLLNVSKEKIDFLNKEKVLSEFVHGRLAGHLIQKQTTLLAIKNFNQSVKNKLMEHNLSEAECKKFENYLSKNINKLSSLSHPELIHKNSELPRSILSIPNGPQKGTYALLKTHNNEPKIGEGSYNKATLAINLETGESFVFRSGKAESVLEFEQKFNELASQHPEFVGGTVVKYTGDIRERNNPSAEKQKNVEKVGILMPYLKGGDMYEKLKSKYIDSDTRLQWAKECTQGVDVCHTSLHIVHKDLKPGNIMLTEDGHAKIGDFGMAIPEGQKGEPNGTLRYAAPELIIAGKNNEREIAADSKMDIWSLGCIFAEIFPSSNRNNWVKYADQMSNIEHKKFWNIKPEDFEKDKAHCFPNRSDNTHPDYVIDQCLQLDPKKRPTAAQVAKMWENVQV